MDDLMRRLEDRRLEMGLRQADVGAALGVTQAHYSKLAGGLAPLTEERARIIEEWLRDRPPPRLSSGEMDTRIRDLARSIERQLRELNSLLGKAGSRSRTPRRTSRRRKA